MSDERAAVYLRAPAYTDEHYFYRSDPELHAELAKWRAGESHNFADTFAEVATWHEEADAAVSVHSSIDEAEQAAAVLHAERAGTMTFLDLGFDTFGALDAMGSLQGDDLSALATWCAANGMEMPVVEADDESMAARCRAIAERSYDGDWGIELFEHMLGQGEPCPIFAADLVVEDLRSSGRSELVADLYRSFVGPLAYVGPELPRVDPSPAASPPPPRPNPGGGLLGRLFGRSK